MELDNSSSNDACDYESSQEHSRQIAKKNLIVFSRDFHGKFSWCDKFYKEILLTENVYFFARRTRPFHWRLDLDNQL